MKWEGDIIWRRIAILCALIVFVIAYLVLIGWFLHIPYLVQVSPNVSAMVYNTALCFCLISISLLSTIAGYRVLGGIFAFWVLPIAFIALIQTFSGSNFGIDQFFISHFPTSTNPFPGRMATNASICFILIAGALLANNLLPINSKIRFFITNITSLTILSLAIVFVFGYLAKISTAYLWGTTPIAPNASLCLLIFSVGLFAYAQVLGGIHKMGSQRWYPFEIGAVALIIIFLIWHSLTVLERNLFEKMLTMRIQNVAEEIKYNLDMRALTLDRMSNRWKIEKGTKQNVWKSDAKNLLQYLPDFESIQWVDNDQVVQWVVPDKKNIQNQDLDDDLSIRKFLEFAKTKSSSAISDVIYSKIFVKKIFLIAIPLYYENSFHGYMVGAINSDNFFTRYLRNELKQGYAFHISVNGHPIYTGRLQNTSYSTQYKATENFRYLDDKFEVTLFPSDAIVDENHNLLPPIFLVTGIIITLLLVATLQLLQMIRKRASLLEISQQDLEFTQKMAKLGSWSWNFNDQKFTASEETKNILGVKYDFITINEFLSYIHADDKERVKRALFNLPVLKAPLSETILMVTENGQPRNVHLEAKLLLSPVDHLMKIKGSIQDITAMRELEKQLQQSQKLDIIGQLTGGIAHDFNNLLMIIQGNLELIALKFPQDQKLQDYIGAAIRASQRGANLIKRLLAFSRKQQLNPTIVDLQTQISSIVKLLKPALGESIAISLNVKGEIWPIFVDSTQLENSIINLAVNARDAMKGKGELDVLVENATIEEDVAQGKYLIAPGQYVRISVSDTGSGIPREIIDHVFEPFFTTKEKGKGTGLGLSMVYGFVKQSKGHITIYSEEGHGTTVNIYLPRADVTEKATEEKTIAKIQECHGTETILVVEDEEDLGALAVSYLENCGYQIIYAKNGDEALPLLQNNKIDLLFSDIVMPGKFLGYELAIEAKKLQPDIKILLTTGYSKTIVSEKYKGYQEMEMITKPYSLQDLGKKIRAILDNKSIDENE